VNEYGHSAARWKEYSNTPEFVERFNTLVEDTSLTNEQRAEVVEQFLI
jgi:hypothetical protein